MELVTVADVCKNGALGSLVLHSSGAPDLKAGLKSAHTSGQSCNRQKRHQIFQCLPALI